MTKRDFLAITDFSRDEIVRLFDLAARMKSGRYRDTPLSGKSLAMIFAKSSTRTRVSFEVGTYELGGHALFLSSKDIQLGRGEPIADTARVLSRYVDAIMIRTNHAEKLDDLARHATVPVINGLTDYSHPCQIVADVMTFEERRGPIKGRVVAWTADDAARPSCAEHAAATTAARAAADGIVYVVASAAATLALSTAGWVVAVSASSRSGPSKTTRARLTPSAALASSNTAFAAGEAS